MKRPISLCAALAIVLSAATALAADLTGTWSGQMPGQNGDTFHISYTFRQDGAKFTGSVKSPHGDDIEITDGTIDGNKLSFTIDVNGTIIRHEGTVSGDSIKLTTKTDAPDYPGGDLTLTRDKSK